MRAKFIVGVFLMFLTFGILVSALSVSKSPNPENFFKEGDSRIVTIINEDGEFFNSTTSLSIPQIKSGSNTATFSVSPNQIINENQTELNISLLDISGSFPIGSYSTALNFNVTNSTTEEPVNIPINYVSSFCRDGPQNHEELFLDVTVKNRGEGRAEEWKPLDRIEVEVRLRNNQLDELRDVIFKIGLFEEGTMRNVIEDMIWISLYEDEYEIGDVREGRTSSRYTFEFRIDPSEVKLGKNYLLVVKAYPDGKESTTCIDYSDGLTGDLGDSKFFGTVQIGSETNRDKMVVIDDSNLLEKPIIAQCGQEVTFFADIYNIGDRDFEDRIKVTLSNAELGLNLEDIIIGDLFEGEKTTATFHFTVPKNSTEKIYTLYMRTHYDYRESDDIYRRTSTKTFTAFLEVTDCIIYPDVHISATLDSEAKAGEEMIIKATIANTRDSSRDFIVEVTGYSDWASLEESSRFLTVGAESTEEISLKFNVNRDASGEKVFTIKVHEGTELIETRDVLVNIEPRGFLGFTGLAITNGNSYLWGLGFLNIILVIVIIFVAVRIARREKPSEA